MSKASNPDLSLLRVFMTVVRCGGISAAQETLNLSQSTISNHVIALEERLGCKLCERGRSGFRITENGVTVLRAAERLFTSVADFQADTAHLRGTMTGELRVGIVDNTVTDEKAPLHVALRRFYDRPNNVQVSLVVDAPQELEGRLLDHRLDVAICGSTQHLPGLEYDRLYRERHGFFCGRGHPLYERDHVNPEDIRGHWVVERGYRKHGEVRRLGLARADTSADQMEAQLILILSGRYLGFLPLHYARPWVEDDRLKEISRDRLAYEADFYLVTRRGGQQVPAVRAFVEDVHAAYKDSEDNGP